jgi:8-oxo-dGTP diphosphatase
VQHRVRAAVILVKDDRLLLVKHVHPETGDTWWIPPGGGLEDEDATLLACAKREVFEETGLRVDLGKLVYLREFVERDPGIHNIELLFLGRNPRGQLTLDNVAGSGPDEDYIRDVAWVPRRDLQGLTIYPEHLADGFWDDLRTGFPVVKFLGTSTG